MPFEHPNELTEEAIHDWELILQANPVLDIRISRETVEEEARGSLRSFGTERGGVGDWPDPSAEQDSPIRVEEWLQLKDETSELVDPIVLAFDVSPERRASIAAAGANLEGLFHIEVLPTPTKGTSWLPQRLRELRDEHSPTAIVCDGYGHTASMVSRIEDLGVRVEQLSTSEHAQACGRLVDLVQERRIRHLGSADIIGALRGARTRPLGDAWAWSRRSSEVDISPLVAATLAISAAFEERGRSVYDERGVLAL
jgi:hypothetical protein